MNGETGECVGEIAEVDTSEFRREYLERLNPNEVLMDSIPLRVNKPLLTVFPGLFIKRIIRRIKR